MAKKGRRSARAKGNSEPLPTMEDEFDVPKVVQEAADEYKKSSISKNRAAAKFKGAKSLLLELMGEHGIPRVRIELPKGDKWLEYDEKADIKEKAVKTPPTVEDEEDE